MKVFIKFKLIFFKLCFSAIVAGFGLLQLVQAVPSDIADFSQKYPPEVKKAVWKITNGRRHGTGFLIDTDLFVTNFHVIKELIKPYSNFKRIYLTQDNNPNTLQVKRLIKLSSVYDLALLEIEPSSSHFLSNLSNLSNLYNLFLASIHPKSSHFLTLNSESINQTSFLYSLGYPRGMFQHIIKTGPLKLKDRSFYINSSDINGASGSPILDASHKVFGVLHASIKNHMFFIHITDLKNFIENHQDTHVLCKNLTPGECAKRALENLKQKAEQNHTVAQAQLALNYSNGIGFEKDLSKAFFWYKKAAKEDTSSQYNLALMYLKPDTGKPNFPKAFFWMKQAAVNGLPEAQYQVALMYLNGKGVQQNHSHYVYWLELAAKQQHINSQNLLKKIKNARTVCSSLFNTGT